MIEKKDLVYCRFMGGKTDKIDHGWGAILIHTNYIPVTDDLINLKDWLENDKAKKNMLEEFGTTLFIVSQRELRIPEEFDKLNIWLIYIKPYFPDQG